MAVIRFGHRRARFSILLSGSLLFGVALLVLLNLSTTLSNEEAETRVRTLLSREVTQRYMPLVMNRKGNEPDVDSARQMAKELRRIRNLKFVSVDVGRLIPDFLLRPHRPTHIVRVVVRDGDRQYTPRYFRLPWDGIDGDSSRIAWFFSF
jgi:hypothetical protein